MCKYQHMRVTSLVAAVASRTGKIWKNRLRVFENRQESRSKVRQSSKELTDQLSNFQTH